MVEPSTNDYNIDDTRLEVEIQEVKSNLRIELVSHGENEQMWNMLIEKYHYLGSARAIGPRLKYIVWLGERPISAIGFNQAVFKLGVRDKFIEWNDAEKQKYLRHVLNNNRFLVLPWVRIKNLASHIMALTICKLKKDWLKIYGVEPYIIETFVDIKKYTGTCYKASNWMYIGNTRGFKKVGKSYEYHGNHKAIYMYFIKRNYKKLIGCTGRPIQVLKKRRKPLEMVYMQLQTNNWHPELLEEANTRNIVEKLPEMLQQHMEKYIECFPKEEHEFNANIYIKGLLSNLERKSIEPISLEFNPDKRGVRNLQFFMKNAGWKDKEAKITYQKEFLKKVSEPNGMITVDESGNRKKGNKSVGVASQYCGNVGKVDNSQVGVYIGYSGDRGYGLLAAQLFMPEKWFGEDYKIRRTECLVPKDLTFKTKPQIAIELIKELAASNSFEAKWIGADSLYGNNKEFLRSIPDNFWYFADVSNDTQVWLTKPEFEIPTYTGKGRKPTKLAPSCQSKSVAKIADDNAFPWKQVYLGEGSQGPVYSNIKCIRVYRDLSNDSCDPFLQDCWLFIRQREDGEIRYSISNAPSNIQETELCRASLLRWPVEQCFDEMKGSLGMDHCEARSWPAWQRHMLLVFIAYEFLYDVRLSIIDKKKDQFYH